MLITFSACKGNKKPSGEEASNSDTSTPVSSDTSSADEVVSNPKNETESNGINSEPSKPTSSTEAPVNKKTAQELIIGKWKYVTDISEILLANEFEVDGEVYITVISEFKTDGTFIEKADEALLKSALQGAFGDSYTDDIFYGLKDSFTNTGKYKFDGDTLLIKFETDPDFTDVTYKFSNDNKFTLETPSTEIKYTRF